MAGTTDIEKLMEQIREAVEDDEPGRSAVTYIDEAREDKINSHSSESAEVEIPATTEVPKITSSPPPAGSISLFIKKLTKRASNFIGAPTPMRVNSFHLLLIRIINEQDIKIKNLESALLEEQERIKELSLRLTDMERKVDDFSNRDFDGRKR